MEGFWQDMPALSLLDKINAFGGYGEFGIPSGSGSGPVGLGGTFGAAPPDDEGSPF